MSIRVRKIFSISALLRVLQGAADADDSFFKSEALGFPGSEAEAQDFWRCWLAGDCGLCEKSELLLELLEDDEDELLDDSSSLFMLQSEQSLAPPVAAADLLVLAF